MTPDGPDQLIALAIRLLATLLALTLLCWMVIP